MTTTQDQQSRAAYDLIDRFLRNNLDDADYAEYSAALDVTAAARALPAPENVREGEAYDNPAFEDLARTMGVWGTAQAALCAQFFLAGHALPAGDPAAWMSSEDDHYQGTSADWQVSGDKRADDDIALYTAAQVQAMGRVPLDTVEAMKLGMAADDATRKHCRGTTNWAYAMTRFYEAALAAAPRPPAAQEVPSGVLDAIRAAGMQLLKGVDGFKLEKAVTASASNVGSAAQEGKTVACACGDEFPIDSYGGGFLDAKGRCFGCDVAVEANMGNSQVSAPVQMPDPVAGRCRFIGEPEWKVCSPEHVRMVLSEPHKWKDYEVRYLYAEPDVRALLASARAVPGWQWVPVEPTAEMMLHNSGCQHHAHDDRNCSAREVRRKVWAHMLEAAPKEPAP